MPSLFRFLFMLGVIAALVWGGMVALVAYVQLEPREITETVPIPKAPIQKESMPKAPAPIAPALAPSAPGAATLGAAK